MTHKDIADAIITVSFFLAIIALLTCPVWMPALGVVS